MSEEIEKFSSETVEGQSTPPKKKKGGLKLGVYLRMLLRKSWLIILMSSLTTGAAYFLSRNDPDTYIGSFRILVEPLNSADKLTEASTLARTGGVPRDDLFSLDYPTQLEILKSSTMMSKIAESINERHPAINADALKINLNQFLVVQRIGKSKLDSTKIIEVVYQGVNPNLVQLVLETTADKYLEYSLDERQTSIKAGVEFIEQQIPDLQERASELQAKHQSLQQQYNFIEPSIKAEELLAQVNQLKQQEIQTQNQLEELRKLYSTLQQQLNLTPEQALIASSLSQDPNRAALISQLQEIDSQIAFESSRFTTNSPRLRSLGEQREQIANLLNQKTQSILSRNSSTLGARADVFAFTDTIRLGLMDQLISTANQIDSLEIRSQALKANREPIEQQTQQFPEVLSEYNEISRQLALTNQIVDRLLNQKETLRVEGAQNSVPWELLSKPQMNLDEEGNPVGFPPDRTKKLAAGFMGGGLIAVGIIFLLEKRRDTFYTASDVQDILSMPLLAEIPLCPSLENCQDNIIETQAELIVDDDSLPISEKNLFLSLEPERLDFVNHPEKLAKIDVVEEVEEEEKENQFNYLFLSAFDSLYTNLRFAYVNPAVRSMVVCGVESGDGQSTIAINLAKAAAAKGEEVLLVDANWGNPQLNHRPIHEYLDLPNYKGLVDLLSNPDLTAEEVIQRLPEKQNLSVLTVGGTQNYPPQPLWSTKMEYLAELFETKYDLIIYDPPHFLDSGDISFLIDHTDGVLMVVTVAKTHQSKVKQALKMMDKFNLNGLGSIATCVGKK